MKADIRVLPRPRIKDSLPERVRIRHIGVKRYLQRQLGIRRFFTRFRGPLPRKSARRQQKHQENSRHKTESIKPEPAMCFQLRAGPDPPIIVCHENHLNSRILQIG